MNKLFVLIFVALVVSASYTSYASAATSIACAVQSPENGKVYSVIDNIYTNFSITPVNLNNTNFTFRVIYNGVYQEGYTNFSLAYPDPPIAQNVLFSQQSASTDWEPGTYNYQLYCCANNSACATSTNMSFVVKGEPVNTDFTQTVLSVVLGFIALAVLAGALLGIGIYLKNNFQDLNTKQVMAIMIAVFIVVILAVAIINYAASQTLLTWNPHTGEVFR